MNPNSVPPDYVDGVAVTSPPAWLAPALQLAPLLAACFVTACGAFLLGPHGAMLAAFAGLVVAIVCRISTHGMDRITELRRRLRTNQFMQDSINAIPMPIFVKNRRGRLIMINDAYCEHRRLTREEILGRTASELAANPELAKLIAEEDALVLKGGRIRKEEKVPHAVTGEMVCRVVTKALSHTESNKPIIIGAFFDVTSMRLAEQEVRDTLAAQSRLQGFLQLVLDALPNPLFVKDPQHRYILSNRAHLESTGLSADELLGKRAGDVMSAEHASELEAHEDVMLAGEEGVIYESEHTVSSLNGPNRQEIVRKVVGHDADGQRVIIAATTNITSLRHAEARWQFALEGAGDGLWDWDIPSGQTFYSPRWKAMQGFEDGEIGNQQTERTRRIHPDDLEAAQAALDIHLSGRVPIYICEVRQMRKNGQYMWILDRGQVVERNHDGVPLRMIGIYTDITHHKHAEEELRRHRDRLKDMVEEQTIGLLRAKEEAERANAAKSQFLANMSHELRTPMHAVLSFARLGEEKAGKALEDEQPTPEKLPVYFQRIRESGDRLLTLLNDLLDLSKLEAGRMVLHIQRIDLHSLVQEALHEFEASLLARSLKAEVVCESTDTLVMADRTRLGQVVRNLLSNAIKFSPEGSCIQIRLEPRVQTSETIGRGVELVVADEGPGIPAAELDTVFDKFIQSSKTRSSAGGTGLGLPICREIINAHHGEIFARNLMPQGTEFVARIPRHPPAAAHRSDVE